MSNLLYKKQKLELAPGVTLVQNLDKSNTTLEHIEFKVIEMEANAAFKEELTEQELCAVVLTGNVDAVVDGEKYSDLGTRDSVFEKKPTDSVYVPSKKTIEITSNKPSKLALCYGKSTKTLDTKVVRADENNIERRGKYSNKRLVHDILPDTIDFVENLLVVEVYTDQGNFSSYPPHKHDKDDLPNESLLEETYYHEINPDQGFVFQRVYTDDRSLDETMAVESQDCVSVPKGYHPVGVPDGYDLYYLNVMAGPHRKWVFHNDEDHEWILERE